MVSDAATVIKVLLFTVMIPETYVPDLQLRLGLYRRLADLEELQDIDGFGAELIDRFGPLPDEVQHLLKIVYIKALCRRANVDKLDAGPKGIVIQFRNKTFSNPAASSAPICRRLPRAGRSGAATSRVIFTSATVRRSTFC